MPDRRVLLAIAFASLAVGSSVATVSVSTTGADAQRSVAGGATVEGTRIRGGDDLSFQAGPGQVVRGRTDVPPGTELTVRVQSTDANQPYLRSVTTIVDSTGGFRAVFDVSTASAGTPLDVVVHRSGSNLANASATVVECSSACDPLTPATPSAVVTPAGDGLSLRTEPGQAIRGRTNLRPGTEVVVRVRSAEPGDPFIVQRTATVDENGTFRAVFDFDRVRRTMEFRTSVRYNATTLTTERGLATCLDDCESAPASDGRGEFADAQLGVVQVTNGSTARIGVQVGAADRATLTVGSPDSDYALTASVTDGNDDGDVVVLFNTSAAASGTAPVSPDDQTDGVRIRTQEGTFTATDYRLALHPPGNRSVSVASGLLVVVQDDESGAPLSTPEPGVTGAIPWGSVGALAAGIVLAVLGLGHLFGFFDL